MVDLDFLDCFGRGKTQLVAKLRRTDKHTVAWPVDVFQ